MTAERERIPMEEVLRLLPQKAAEKARYWGQVRDIHAAQDEQDDAAETGAIARSYESAIERMDAFLAAIRTAAVENLESGWEATVPPDWWFSHLTARQLKELAGGTDEQRLEWARSLFRRI